MIKLLVQDRVVKLDMQLLHQLSYLNCLIQDISRENKLRLLMILAAIYPEKFEGEKGLNLMKVWLLSYWLSHHFIF